MFIILRLLCVFAHFAHKNSYSFHFRNDVMSLYQRCWMCRKIGWMLSGYIVHISACHTATANGLSTLLRVQKWNWWKGTPWHEFHLIILIYDRPGIFICFSVAHKITSTRAPLSQNLWSYMDLALAALKIILFPDA